MKIIAPSVELIDEVNQSDVYRKKTVQIVPLGEGYTIKLVISDDNRYEYKRCESLAEAQALLKDLHAQIEGELVI